MNLSQKLSTVPTQSVALIFCAAFHFPPEFTFSAESILPTATGRVLLDGSDITGSFDCLTSLFGCARSGMELFLVFIFTWKWKKWFWSKNKFCFIECSLGSYNSPLNRKFRLFEVSSQCRRKKYSKSRTWPTWSLNGIGIEFLIISNSNGNSAFCYILIS